MKEKELPLIRDLFRQQFAKIVAVITRQFSLKHIELAEDIVSDTFLTASEVWPAKGVPQNPQAWLYAVARQKTLYHFRRNEIFEKKVIPAVTHSSERENHDFDLDFSDQNISDSQLRMVFAVCDPGIASEAQIGLALRILCGFSIEEIASAFFTNKETINKRLFRAKEKLRQVGMEFEFSNEINVTSRLDNVLHVIYLMFNEGYYSTSQQNPLRKDFCLEAMRLCNLLLQHPLTGLPRVNALMALMCFHSSRFLAREGDDGMTVLYEFQDEKQWNHELISQGNSFLAKSALGVELSSYHLEAGIAFWHCQKEDSEEKWRNIVIHYELLLSLNDSPTVKLNYLYALYKHRGAAFALEEMLKSKLPNDHFYFALLGELYKTIDVVKAIECFESGLLMARTDAEKLVFTKRIESLKK